MAHLTFADSASTVGLLHSAHAGGAGSPHRTTLLAHLERIGCLDEADLVAFLEARGASTVVLVADAEDGESERACGQCGDECRCGGDPTAVECGEAKAAAEYRPPSEAPCHHCGGEPEPHVASVESLCGMKRKAWIGCEDCIEGCTFNHLASEIDDALKAAWAQWNRDN